MYFYVYLFYVSIYIYLKKGINLERTKKTQKNMYISNFNIEKLFCNRKEILHILYAVPLLIEFSL